MSLTGTGARVEVPLAGARVAPGETLFASLRRDRIAVRRVAAGALRARSAQQRHR